jgi:hypothetical protein
MSAFAWQNYQAMRAASLKTLSADRHYEFEHPELAMEVFVAVGLPALVYAGCQELKPSCLREQLLSHSAVLVLSMMPVPVPVNWTRPAQADAPEAHHRQW